MASNQSQNPYSKLSLSIEAPPLPPAAAADHLDYSKRAQWLRAAVLGATDGVVSTASLMLGIGGTAAATRAMVLTGFAGLVAGACSMAIGEFVSVYSQLDIERAHTRGDGLQGIPPPNPMQAAAASALAFAAGAAVPLAAAVVAGGYGVRVGAVVASATVALAAFGWIGAVLGGSPEGRSATRVLAGGWLAMAVTFGLTKLVGSKGL
ncbi:Vacuolar iron transporter homolog 4 [Striga hermonthica]|uniref:Vacuolar iron transporter n=1 Tax=Striga hermonthica TaxID=68872 RepID=A0A9N7NCT8_STRHE|nr:Vacuolar iron transporter homolog 4 [Striga hermonthica]